jgi:glucan biosynthesis protein C
LAIAYTPWSWYQIGPFAVQNCRPLHNAVYFFAGAAVGTCGLDRGLLATDGTLARRWPLAVVAAVAGFALWMAPMAAIVMSANSRSIWLELAADVGFVLCCAAGCLAVMAVSVRFGTRRRPLLDSLSANAYGMYLLHYPFVVWMQYALLSVALPAVAKAAIVFGASALLSWGASAGLHSVPLGARLIGAGPRAFAEAQ